MLIYDIFFSVLSAEQHTPNNRLINQMVKYGTHMNAWYKMYESTLD